MIQKMSSSGITFIYDNGSNTVTIENEHACMKEVPINDLVAFIGKFYGHRYFIIHKLTGSFYGAPDFGAAISKMIHNDERIGGVTIIDLITRETFEFS